MRLLNIRLTDQQDAVVVRFIVEFAAVVSDDGDDDEGLDWPLDRMRVGRSFSTLVRLSVGPALCEENRMDKRGVRIDAWVGGTVEPNSERFEGALLDEQNEVVMAQGEVAMLKIPCLNADSGEQGACGFPGLGLMIDWTNTPGAKYQTMKIMPMMKVPTARLNITEIEELSYRSKCPCGGTCWDNEKHPRLPDTVPKRPKAGVPKRRPEASPPQDTPSKRATRRSPA